MKVQFDTGRLRLRASRAELEALRTGSALSAGLDWPGGGWRVHATAAQAFSFDGAGVELRLSLPLAELDALAARLPSRDGLRYAAVGGAIELRFEVDVHDGRSRAR